MFKIQNFDILPIRKTKNSCQLHEQALNQNLYVEILKKSSQS